MKMNRAVEHHRTQGAGPFKARVFLRRASAIVLAALFVAPTTFANEGGFALEPLKPVYFSDCSHLLFDSRGREELTRAERIRMMDADVKSNLNSYESCINEALSSNRERLSETAAPAAPPGGLESTDTAQSVAEAIDEDDEEVTEEQRDQQTTSPSRPHTQQPRERGSSSVCDAIRAGLEAATNEDERKHFQSLASEYGC